MDPASVRDVLARVKARGATGRAQSAFDGSQRVRNGQELRGSYFDVDFLRRSKNAPLADSSDADMALPKLADRRVFSLVEPPPMKTSTRKRSFTTSNRAGLSFSPIITAIDVPPQPARHDLDITPITTHFTLSAITTTISQPPTPQNRTGLTFFPSHSNNTLLHGRNSITPSTPRSRRRYRCYGLDYGSMWCFPFWCRCLCGSTGAVRCWTVVGAGGRSVMVRAGARFCT